MSWARLAKAGSPLVGMSDGSVYLLHPGLGCWLRVAGTFSPVSAFSSILNSATGVAPSLRCWHDHLLHRAMPVLGPGQSVCCT